MTFCVGICVTDGLVALADSQIVRGDEVATKAKLSLHRVGGPGDGDDREVFVMTSGLRSIRDKAVRRWSDAISNGGTPFRRMHHLVSAYGEELRRVRAEDEPSLVAAHLVFNSHALIGGQLCDDQTAELYLVHPEGNWTVVAGDAPYSIIGRTPYGKPILDRLLSSNTSLAAAVALAFLAFDSTRASVVDVDYPIDVVVMPAGSTSFRHQRLDAADLEHARTFWRRRLRDAVGELPLDWAAALLGTPSA